jgi:carbamoyl-phosphate synthase large subunit
LAAARTGAILPCDHPKRAALLPPVRHTRASGPPVKRRADLAFHIVPTGGTAALLARSGIDVSCVAKISEGHPNATDLIRQGRVDLVINTPFGRRPRSDGSAIRMAAVASGVPCVTTMPGVFAAVQGIEALRNGDQPRSLQEYHSQVTKAEVT